MTGQMFPFYEQQEAVLPFLLKCIVASVFGAATTAGATLSRPALAGYVQVTVLITTITVLGALTPVAGLSLNVMSVVAVLFASVMSTGFAMHITRAFGGEDMQGGRLSCMITLSQSRDSTSSHQPLTPRHRATRNNTQAIVASQPSPSAPSPQRVRHVQVRPAAAGGTATHAGVGAKPKPAPKLTPLSTTAPVATDRRPTKRAARNASPSGGGSEDPLAQLSLMGFLRGFIGGEERQQRALFGLSAMGHPVLNASGAIGTGLVCLVFAASYGLRSMGVVMLLAVPVGLLHTLAVLPVITSVIGPKTAAWALPQTG